MKFRPCIDLHDGKVKQIVGSSLSDSGAGVTNFVSGMPPSYYADMYYADGLAGGHVIMLGKGNEDAARDALQCHPGNLQVGGGIRPENAAQWLEWGAGKVIVTSFLFNDGVLDWERAEMMKKAVGRDNIVIDLSCVPVDGMYHVACNRWQTVCQEVLSTELFDKLSNFCSEFLVHAVQVEGKQGGIDDELVNCLAYWSSLPVTYAGGIRSMADIEQLGKAGNWLVDFTVGSALDIFGGSMKYSDIAQHGEWKMAEI